MEKVRLKYRVVLIAVFVAMGVLMGFAFFYTMDKLMASFQMSAESNIVEVKKRFLSDTVNNVILEIGQRQDNREQDYRRMIADITQTLEYLHMSTTGQDFLENALSYMQSGDRANIGLVVFEAGTDEVLFQSSGESDSKVIPHAENVGYPIVVNLDYAEYRFTLYVSKTTIDEDVKSQIADMIHSYQFSENAYIWVNQIVDYEGGDDYAIRLIHPNLIDTEGTYLSTNTTDIGGNHPYLEELEGVKRNGEIYFNYYFKKMDSDVISEKITFAKLYADYDWIIAMGVHLDDVESFVKDTTAEGQRSLQTIIVLISLMMIVLIVFVSVSISFLEGWYHRNTNKELKKEVYRDSITDLHNRRAGETQLKEALLKFKRSGQNSAVMMLDIDDFKRINDLCGHDAGDRALRQVAQALDSNTRSTDLLCRWGGEEFVLLCGASQLEDIEQISSKLLSAASDVVLECNNTGDPIKVTISIGASVFQQSDSDFSDIVKRADEALYNAKEQGKNRVVIDKNC